MNIYQFYLFLFNFILFQNLNYTKCYNYKKKVDILNIDNNNKNKNDKDNNKVNDEEDSDEEDSDEEDSETNPELDCIQLKDLTSEKLEEVKNYYKDKYDINKEKNKKLYEEDHNWIENYTFNYNENTKNIPGYIQWAGDTCSMCSVLNALYGLKQFRNFLKKDKLLDNLDDYWERVNTSLDGDYSPFIDDFYSFFSINLFDFLKKIFNNFDYNKIIIPTADLHKEYVKLIFNYFGSKDKLNKKIEKELHHNLLDDILEKFAKIPFVFRDKDGKTNTLDYCLDLLKLKSRDLESMIVEHVKKYAEFDSDKRAMLCSIDNILHFRILKDNDDKSVYNTNLFKEITLTDNLDLENIFDCSDFFKKNPDLKGKLKYKLKSIIIHCGPDSTGGDYGCFRKDDKEDKYWHFQMRKEPTKYTLNEINNMENFACYKTVNDIDLVFELPM